MKKSEIPVQWGDGTGKRIPSARISGMELASVNCRLRGRERNRRAAGKYKSRTARLRIQFAWRPNAVPAYGRLGAREQEN